MIELLTWSEVVIPSGEPGIPMDAFNRSLWPAGVRQQTVPRAVLALFFLNFCKDKGLTAEAHQQRALPWSRQGGQLGPLGLLPHGRWRIHGCPGVVPLPVLCEETEMSDLPYQSSHQMNRSRPRCIWTCIVYTFQRHSPIQAHYHLQQIVFIHYNHSKTSTTQRSLFLTLTLFVIFNILPAIDHLVKITRIFFTQWNNRFLPLLSSSEEEEEEEISERRLPRPAPPSALAS